MFVAGELETVTVISVLARDEFGDPVSGSVTERQIAGCLFAPGDSWENRARFGQARIGDNQVEVKAILYAPAGTVVQPKDRIRIRGVDFEVVGYPLVWSSTGVEIGLSYIQG